MDLDEVPIEPKLLRSLQASKDVKLTHCVAVPGQEQVATATQDGSLLLWRLAAGRPRPIRLGGQQGPLTFVAASRSGELLASASTDATVAVWQNRLRSQQVPIVLKVHFSPVRACDISWNERLLLSASDDKSVKLSFISERRFAGSLLGHSNWVRSAAFSPSASQVVSGGDDKTVRLWDAEQRACLRTWHDCGASVTCTRFGSGEGAVVASTWDSCINLWDIRSHALRQHYSKAHGGCPITEVAFHPSKDLLLSCSTDRLLRIWDLRAGRLCRSLEGHERPVLSCCWDERGEQFASCDSQVVHFWSLPANSFARGPHTAEAQRHELQEARSVAAVVEDGQNELQLHAQAVSDSCPRCGQAHLPDANFCRSCGAKREGKAPTRFPEQQAVSEAAEAPPRPLAQDFVPPSCPQWSPAAAPPDPSSGLARLLEAAWAGDSEVAAATPTQAACLAGALPESLPEAAAKVLEQLVTQMDVLTRTLESLEARLERTEAATQEVAGLIRNQSQTRSGGLPQH
eukprot:TRINITY_DN48513_c0_g1_i1.p1 TRINITY_DN48513_c0_g1~~TRINITY_DN48513_c0_g1_i1.p1  ORF type:complete len:515 (-),score=78.43 TRINITY_DN48513_c0_g1_i1:8-1552(-)